MSALRLPVSYADLDSNVAFVEELFRAAGPAPFAVRFTTGVVLASHPGIKPEFTIVLKHPGALRRMFSSPTELALGEAYIFDDYDLEGDVEAAVRFGKSLVAGFRSLAARLRFRALLEQLPAGGPPRPGRTPPMKGKLHSRGRDQAAIRYHYGISSDFYSLFLDRRMIYSAAEFDEPDEDLDVAQERKLEGICRGLDLRSGEEFLDIGCGWGGLILYAAKHFGVEAVGITLSERQAEFARERIRKAGMEDRCRVQVRDYRDLEGADAFQKVASIGMIEHVGARNLPAYFGTIYRLLANGGALYNSGIARPLREPARRKGSFTDTYVFPDGELETIEEILQAAEEAGFELRSAENRRSDYALTLRRWVRRLEARADEGRRAANDVAYRIWRLYMAGSAARFAAGELYLLSSLFGKTRAS